MGLWAVRTRAAVACSACFAWGVALGDVQNGSDANLPGLPICGGAGVVVMMF